MMWRGISVAVKTLWGRYQQALDRRPVRTQIVTTAALWAVGDVTAQKISKSKDMDWNRTAVTTAFAAGFIGPTGHFWYLGLDAAVNRLALKSLAANVGLKVIADTLVFGPVHVIAFFAFMEVVEGRGLAGAVRKVKDDFWSTFVVELAFWPAFQAINFWRVPVEHQLLAVNAACILDCTFLCWACGHSHWADAFSNVLPTTTSTGNNNGNRK